MEKPILLGLQGETQGIIQKYNAGVCFEPENEIDFHRAIEDIIQPEIYSETKEGSKSLVQDFDRSKIANDMLECLQEV
jgi:hypothetical protein